ncbi:1-acyl-sn-glycerol-3-phosphate acyltransferase [Streptomyces sp. NPDC091272]|uniref:1-acyl-sn-glycerol-3-phosphate acyltransferase n=1 Tax=Streptomyces sp. NPDC091272 TaxID=3365981 RepID=UPI0037F98D76
MFNRRRTALVDAVLRHPQASREIRALSMRTGADAVDARRRVRRCLRELVATRGAPWTDLFARAMRRALVPLWRVEILDEDRRMLRGPAASDACLIFLPQHQAYMDPLFVSQALRDCGRPRPLWFAGDNLRLPLLAPLAARAGVVFLRRASPADEDYRSALRLYLRHLVDSGETLEWYQEGGRSRTGLPGPPRYGLLEHTVAAVRDNPGKQVWLVPVALSSSVLPDAAVLAGEELGQPKRPESLRWFWRYVRAQRRTRGVVQVRFAPPLSVGAYVGHRGGALTDASGARVLAREVRRALCQVTPVTGQALVALAVSAAGPGCTTAQVHRMTQPLLEAVERSGAPTLDTQHLRTERGVREILLRLRDVGAVSLRGVDASPPDASLPVASPPDASLPVASPPVASPPVASPPDASPPVASPPDAEDTVPGQRPAAPGDSARARALSRPATAPVLHRRVHEHRAVATLYRNQGIHWLWPRAAAEVAALRASRVETAGAWDTAVQELRGVLSATATGTGLGVEPGLLATAVVELKRLATPTSGADESPWTFPAPLVPAGSLIAPAVLADVSAGQLLAFQELAQQPHGLPVDVDLVLTRVLARARSWADSAVGLPPVPPRAPGFYRSLLLDVRRSGLLEPGLEAAQRRRYAHTEARQLHADLLTLARQRADADAAPESGLPHGGPR